MIQVKITPRGNKRQMTEWNRNLLASAPVQRLPRYFPDVARQNEVLTDLQRSAAHNYFRMFHAWERLDRNRARPERNWGAMLTRELERERSRIARELHAGAGQPLAGIKLHLDLLRSDFPELAPKIRDGIGRIQLLADQALEQVRAVSHRLYPPDWQQLSLTEAIESLLHSSGVTQTSEVTLEITAFDPEPSHEVKVTLYRCCQECLSNILRHSGAKHVGISLRQSGHRIILTVEDDGTGFDAADAAAKDPHSRGIGLPSMEEQVRALGGSLILQSGEGGARLEFSVPIAEP